MNNPDHISESLETGFWVKILKLIDADPATWMGKIWIRDKKHSGSATLLFSSPNGFSRYPTITMAQIADPKAVKIKTKISKKNLPSFQLGGSHVVCVLVCLNKTWLDTVFLQSVMLRGCRFFVGSP
jgi:hypothetical protein